MIGQRRRQAGFTVVEAMVSLAVLSIMAVALGGTFLVAFTSLSREASQIAAGTAVSAASLALTRDLSSSTVTSALPDTLTVGSGTLVLTAGPPGATTTATYTIDANSNLVRTLSGAASGSFTAARGVKTLTVSSGIPACQLTVSLLPSATGATAQALTVSQRTQGCF